MGDSRVTNEIKTEIIEIEYNCLHCQKSFSDIGELDYHEKINHANIKEEPDWVIAEEEETISNKKPGFEKLEEDPDWVIDEEDEPISNRAKKPVFEKSKEDKRPFSCSKCSKSFYTRASLNKHTSIHHKTYPCQCHLCEKAFLHPSLLQYHIEEHQNLRNVKCYHCDSAFNTNRALQKHLKGQGVLPKKDKKFNCDVCEDKFRTGAEVITHCVNKHSMDVNDVKPYICNICSLACCTSFKLWYHKKYVHKRKAQKKKGNKKSAHKKK